MKKLFSCLYGMAILCGVFVLSGCSNKPSGDDKEELTCPFPPVIYLQPYGNFSQEEASKVGRELEKLLDELFNVALDCEVLPSLPLSDSLLNKAKTRYRADKIIRSMSLRANKHDIYIGLTHRDISCSIRGKDDWGVQGLSLIPGKACVVSTFRVKDKHDLPLVVCHEFIHTYFNYNHCPKNDPHCLMQDAKGHPSYKDKRGLCEYCKSELVYSASK